MDKSPSKKGSGKIGNKLVRRFFKWRGSKTKHDESTVYSENSNFEDKESQQRIKNMEQARTISAMKNHIKGLEEKLDSLQNKGDIDLSNFDGMKILNGAKKNAGLKYQSEEENSGERIKMKNSKQQTNERNSSKGREIIVHEEEKRVESTGDLGREYPSLIEAEADSNSNGKVSPSLPGESNDSPIEVGLNAKLDSDIKDEITTDNSEARNSLPESNKVPNGDNQETIHCMQGIKDQIAVDFRCDSKLNEFREIRLQSESCESQHGNIGEYEDLANKPLPFKSTCENIDSEKNLLNLDANQSNVVSRASYIYSCSEKRTGTCDETNEMMTMKTTSSSIMERRDETSPSAAKCDLGEINEELKRKVALLEEQLCVTKEERKNMQAFLELQKQKALKNIAFTLEYINRKNLCEYKGTFESRIKELNEEKKKIMEKLQSQQFRQGGDVNSCEECLGLKGKPVRSKMKYAKILRENRILKRRLRKLNGDFKGVKMAIRSLALNDGDRIGVGTQTETFEVKRKDVKIECKVTHDTSLNDIHDGIRDIATKLSMISISLDEDHRKIRRDESFTCNAMTDSTSSSNESGIESLLVSPVSDGLDHEDNGYKEHNQSDPILLLDFYCENCSQLLHPVDDGDSIASENCNLQPSVYDIEEPLSRIDAKYMKINEELENIATMKLNCNARCDNSKRHKDVNLIELDPETKRIIDDINQKYNDYFKKTSKLSVF